MKKWFLMLLLSSCSTVEQPKGTHAVVTEYGIYGAGNSIGTINLPQTNTGVLTIEDNTRKLLKVTHRVPAEVGTTFGYCYDIPSPTGALTITRKLVNPKMTKPDGTVSKGYEYQRTLTAENGIASYCSNYTLEYEWEAVAGLWEFSIFLHNKKILQQTFELYK